MKKVLGALAAFLFCTNAMAATLLPNGQQQFIDGNGKPYAGGKVWFYSNFPTCSVLKNTWQDTAQTVLNTNPVTLDAAGRATIFGSGSYCQVLKDSLGNTVWTKFTADTAANSVSWAGTSGGTGNAQTLSSSTFSSADGQTIYFVAGNTNTGSTTLTVSGTTAAVVKPTAAGAVFLAGGEIVSGNVIGVTYEQSTGQFQLITNDVQQFGTLSNLAAATTTNLNSISSHNVNVTGSGVTITSFGSGGSDANLNSIYFVKFAASNTITYNATSMITPTGQDLYVSAGDMLVLTYLGGSNWQVLGVTPTGLQSINAQTGTTYTLQASDRGKLVTFTNASGVAVTVPSAASGAFVAGYTTLVQNINNTTNVTLTPASGTIGGQSSVVIPPGSGFRLISDGTNWQTSGSMAKLTASTAQTVTSGTTVDFTGIPSWVKRITLLISNTSFVSPGDTLYVLAGTGPSTFENTGYTSYGYTLNGGGASSSTTGFTFNMGTQFAFSGTLVISNITSNTWVATGQIGGSGATNISILQSAKTTASTLASLRIGGVLGRAFASGTFNILYE